LAVRVLTQLIHNSFVDGRVLGFTSWVTKWHCLEGFHILKRKEKKKP